MRRSRVQILNEYIYSTVLERGSTGQHISQATQTGRLAQPDLRREPDINCFLLFFTQKCFVITDRVGLLLFIVHVFNQ